MNVDFKYDPKTVEEDYYIGLRDIPDSFISQTVNINGRRFMHEYNNPPSIDDLAPGDVILLQSQLSSSSPHSLIPIVFMGGVNKSGVSVSGINICTFRYKFLGTSTIMMGLMVSKNIYVEVWP